ncbi:unnamed protein product [Prorocentrum cordatum]|uniref:RNA-dependent RNA polymerase n=1 Tax=Prorocentrum cordatum TaxID=2364126 RepID=A0ABN9WSV5_9DINO|nr:unnamed protein product [Polarella glacialis]
MVARLGYVRPWVWVLFAGEQQWHLRRIWGQAEDPPTGPQTRLLLSRSAPDHDACKEDCSRDSADVLGYRFVDTHRDRGIQDAGLLHGLGRRLTVNEKTAIIDGVTQVADETYRGWETAGGRAAEFPVEGTLRASDVELRGVGPGPQLVGADGGVAGGSAGGTATTAAGDRGTVAALNVPERLGGDVGIMRTDKDWIGNRRVSASLALYAGAETGLDARLLGITLQSDGHRTRIHFRDAVAKFEHTPLPGWPLEGPRLAVGCSIFVDRRCRGPLEHFTQFGNQPHLTSDDYGAAHYESIMRMIASLARWDQVSLPDLVGVGEAMRQAQLYRYVYAMEAEGSLHAALQGRRRGHGSAEFDLLDEASAFALASKEDGRMMVCPDLLHHVCAIAERGADILKSLRNAREVHRELEDAVRRFGEPPMDLDGPGALAELRVSQAHHGEAVAIAPVGFDNVEILRQDRCTGDTLRRVISHCTSRGLIRRELLSALGAVYSFIRVAGHRPLSKVVSCVDASWWGVGITEKDFTRDQVVELSSFNERWRFGRDNEKSMPPRAFDIGMWKDETEETETSTGFTEPYHVLKASQGLMFEGPIKVFLKPPEAKFRSVSKEGCSRDIVPMPGERHSVLEQESVSAATRRDYERRAHRFYLWAGRSRLGAVAEEQLNETLVMYIREQFLMGGESADARKLFASLAFAGCHLGLEYSSRPCATRAARGWRTRAPPRSRLRLPWATCCLVIRQLVQGRERVLAKLTAVAFALHLGPSEALSLTTHSLVPPSVLLKGPRRTWSMTLHLRVSGVAGQTGVYDDSLVLDSPAFPWHEEAGHKLLVRALTQDEITKRGRWASDQVVRRYTEARRIQERLNMLPHHIRGIARHSLDAIGAVLCAT